MDALNGMMEQAKHLQLIKGVKVGRGDDAIEISHLFFADDTLFCQPVT